MTDKPVYLISGYGRCGSSLIMQMLDAGGMGCLGTWPSFEVPNGDVLALPWAFLGGRAVKVLDLLVRDHNAALPARAGGYRAIWLDRDAEQQARSIQKFLAWLGQLPPHCQNRNARRALARDMINARSGAVTRLHRLTGQAPLLLSFETILANPPRAAERLAQWTGLDLDTGAMAAQVMRRGPHCLPYMLESRLMARERVTHG